MTILFRDREISDAFGFVYHKTTPDMAAEDVLRRLRQIIREAPQEQVTIAIVLDGENPWEHYYEGGEQFLSLLYKACSTGALDDGSGSRRLLRRSPKRSKPRQLLGGSATSIRAPGSIRTIRSGSATRKTIGDGTW